MRQIVTFRRHSYTEDEYGAPVKSSEDISLLVDVIEAPSRTALSRDGYTVDYDVSMFAPRSGRLEDLTDSWTVTVPGYGEMNIISTEPLFHSIVPNWRIRAKRVTASA